LKLLLSCVMKRLRAVWQSLWIDADRRVRMGRFLGLVFITVGFIVIGKAWDGAASINFAQGQIPYLLSGGFMGLGLIVAGSMLLLLSTVRSERQIMTDLFEDMSRLLGRNLARLQFSSNGAGDTDGQVVAAQSTYHRAECKVLQGKQGLTMVTLQQAAAEGLEPCRVCDPPAAPAREESVSAASETPGP
jgi:hypothetical protein